MLFSVLTLFKKQVEDWLSHSIMGRAIEAGRFLVDVVDIRDFAINDYGKVDDQIYGGGTGMLMMAEPLYQATKTQMKKHDELKAEVIYLSPRGETLDQRLVEELAKKEHLLLVSGHYEGVDERYLEAVNAREVSLGDFVLSGGELPALAVLDAVARRLPGVLPNEEAFQDESLSDGLLAEPQYTRPSSWRGKDVPAVLLSGHAANIEAWRRAKKIETTLQRRPDLAGLKSLDATDWKDALSVLQDELERSAASGENAED